MSTTIRPIVQSEAPQFLSLLCHVFGLDEARASHIFYHEPFFDVNRKWALWQDERMISILTTTPLQFGWGSAIGIAGVATEREFQGKGYAKALLDHVLEQSENSGEGAAILFAHDTKVYERCGFELMDHVIRAPILSEGFCDDIGHWELAQVQEAYATWAAADSARLIRDMRRWQYWQFVFRDPIPFGGGYATQEGALCREAIVGERLSAWPLPAGTDWYGLRSMVDVVGVPLGESKEELLLMGRGFDSTPQMFMTDQF